VKIGPVDPEIIWLKLKKEIMEGKIYSPVGQKTSGKIYSPFGRNVKRANSTTFELV